MPTCPLEDPQCTLSDQTESGCTMGYPNCKLNTVQFPSTQLRQELDRWNNTSLPSAAHSLSNDPDLVSRVSQIRSEISSILADEETERT